MYSVRRSKLLKSYWLLLGNSDCMGIDRMIAGEEGWYYRVVNFMS